MRPVLLVGLSLFAVVAAGAGAYKLLHHGSLVEDAKYRIRHGDLHGAELDLDRYLKDHPNSGEAYFEMGYVRLTENNPVAAERSFHLALENHFDPKQVILPLGESYMKQHHFEEALNDFNPATAAPGTKPQVLAVRSSAFLALNRPQEAKQAAAEGMAAAPGDPDPILVAARVDLALGDIKSAEAKAEQVLAKQPERAEAMLLQAEIMMHENRPAESLRLAQAVLKANGSRLDAKMAEARALAALHEDLRALKLVEEVLRYTPRDVGGNYLRVVLAVRQRDFAAADQSLGIIQPVIESLPQGDYFYAVTKLGRNLPAQAEEAAAKYASRNPGDAAGQKLLAFCELAVHKPDRALEVLKPLLDAGNPDADVLDLQARAQAMKGNLNAAEQSLTRAVALQPGNPDILNRLAAAKLGQGNVTAGVADLRKSLAATPDQPVAARTLVQTALAQGDIDGAQREVDELRKATGDTELVGLLDAQVKTARLDLAGARAIYQDMVKRFPDSRDATFGLMQVEARLGQAKTAQQRLSGWMAQHPTDKGGLELQIKSAMADNDRKAAIAAAEQAHAANPVDADITAALGRLYIETGMPARAVSLLDRASTEENPGLVALRGEALIQNNQLGEAGAILTAAVAQNPNDLKARIALMQLYIKQENFIAARSLVTDGLAAMPGNQTLMEALVGLDLRTDGMQAALATAAELQKNPVNMPGALLLPGGAMTAKGDISGAADAYLAAYRKAPSLQLLVAASGALQRTGRTKEEQALSEAWLHDHGDTYQPLQILAGLALTDHRSADAENYLSRVLTLRPSDATALNNMAWVKFGEGDLKAAHGYAIRAYYLAPGPETQDTLGWAELRLGQAPMALTLLEQSAQAKPTPGILYHYAVALQANGRTRDARAAVDRALTAKSFIERPDAEKLQAQLGK